jgi:glycerate 2-kinase
MPSFPRGNGQNLTVRVVVAPGAFKGTLSAGEAARAMVAGWRDADAQAQLEGIPVADGGEGTLDVLVSAFDGKRHHARVTGPLGDQVEAKYAVAMTPGGALAIVEMAQASGLRHVSERRRDPLRATTHGTGELLLAGARHRPGRVLVGVGGSATNDAGAGMAQALGVRLLDRDGRELPPGGAALRGLARIDATGLDRSVRDVDVVVLCDVDNPLVGSNGASAVYGPQKGASAGDVVVLEEALAHFAAVAHRDLGIDLRHVRGGGAAGGLAAGLLAFLGARLRRGFDVVADLLDLRGRFEGSSVVVTGEGRYDRQSERGKAPFGVLRMAAEAGCRTVLIAGQVEEGVEPPADVVLALGDRPGPAAEDRVREAAREAASRVTALLEE